MPQSWKELNITAGTLVTLFIGFLALAATFVSFQSWVDERIDSRVSPLEQELKEFKSEMRNSLASSDASRNRQYGEILSKFDELLGDG